jgi:hypothetical protein
VRKEWKSFVSHCHPLTQAKSSLLSKILSAKNNNQSLAQEINVNLIILENMTSSDQF